MLAILCPGQGAQRPGFLTPWLADEGSRELLVEFSSAAGMDLERLGTDPAADVVDTAVAQPLLVAAGLLAAHRLGFRGGAHPTVIAAGHSIGELTAAAVAGVLTPRDAVRLAAARGAAMADAAAVVDSGMVAVLGGDAAAVFDAAEAAGCTVANHNGPGQLVVAGERAALDRFTAAPPPGARLRPLSVAGAFHTDLMRRAAEPLARAAGTVPFADPSQRWVSGRDGAVITAGGGIRRRLIDQVCLPVRWDRCLARLTAEGVTACIELPPAGTLTAIVGRHLPGVRTLALRDPDDLAAATEWIAAYDDGAAGDPGELSVLVAPASGTWRPARPREAVESVDGWVELGAVVNRVEPVPVVTRSQAPVVEWLAADGDPVREGQPLARLAVSPR